MEIDGMVVGEERTLTLINYVEQKGKYVKKRVTIAPGAVNFVIAGDETYEVIDNTELRQVNVILNDGTGLELYISVLDLVMLERAIGTYFLP